MKKVYLQRILCAALTLAMCVTVVGCKNTTDSGSSDTSDSSTTSSYSNSEEDSNENTDYVKLSFLNGSGTGLFEEEKSLVINKIAEETGVFVQESTVTSDKMTVLMASGDMEADIVYVSDAMKQQVVEGGLVVALDELIDKNAPNIKSQESSLEYWRKNKSYGKDGLYLIPSHIAPNLNEVLESVPYNYGVAPYVRWDYYKELNYPEVKNEDDLLNVLKQMQEAHQTNADGKKTYAMSLTSDSLWSYFTMYNYWNGYGIVNNLVFKNPKDEVNTNALQEDFIGWKAVEYYNKAYRMGIYDPESLTQKGENVTQKITTSQTFYTENSWNNYNQVLADTVGEEAGFEALVSAFPYAYAGETGSYGWPWTLGIASTSKNAEAAIKWIDYLHTEDGARLIYSGVQGVHWDYDENKKPKLFDETIQKYQDEDWKKTNGIRKFENFVGIDNVVKHSDGAPMDLFATKEMLISRNKSIDTEYSKYYGVEYPGQVGEKLGVDVVMWLSDAGSLMPVMPDDLKRVLVKAEDCMLKAIPQMIMANSQEDFGKKKVALIEDLNKLGAQSVIDWTVTEFNKARESLGK